METEEICSIAISPLIATLFAVEWSEDNHISVLTEKGIHVFELIPCPMSPHPDIKFSRSFIYPPLVFPAEAMTTKVNSKLSNMQQKEIYSLIMDEGLTPKMPDIAEMVPKIVHSAWSPQNLIHPKKCLIAILSSTGAVIIAHKISSEWYPTHDFSSIRGSRKGREAGMHVKEKENQNNSIAFLTARSRIKELQASAIAWSEMLVNFAYFVIAYRTGHVLIYKIQRIKNLGEISEPVVAGETSLNDCVKINVLHWISLNSKEYLIIVGYFDGRIAGLRFEDFGECLEVTSIDTYYEYSDRISVSAVKTIAHDDTNIKVFVSKGNFLFLLRFTPDGMLKSIDHLQVEGFGISGIANLSTDRSLIIAENGIMFGIDTQTEKISKLEIKSGLPQTHVRYLGVAHSPSCVMFVNLTSPNSIYDHLVMKEPSKMHLFGFKGEPWNASSFVSQRYIHGRLNQLWDCLEVIRMKATKATDPAAVLPKLSMDFQSLSLHELQIAMWISVITDICERKKVVQGIGSIAGEISELQPLIFILTACNYLERLAKKDSLSKEQKLSANSLRMYLEVYLAGEESDRSEKNDKACSISKRAREILKKTSQLHSETIESCNLCGEIIDDLSWNVNKCPKGHMLPRCAITLLQVTDMLYRTCPICGLIFHPCLDEEYEETACLFCDVSAMEDNRVFSSRSYISLEKSLSRRKGAAAEHPEATEQCETFQDRERDSLS